MWVSVWGGRGRKEGQGGVTGCLECTYGSSAGMLSISDLHSQRCGGEVAEE